MAFRLVEELLRFVQSILASQNFTQSDECRRKLGILHKRGAIGLFRLREPLQPAQDVAAKRLELARRLSRGQCLVDRRA
jgi:hypothetical protein